MKSALFLDRDGVLTKLVDRGYGFTAPWHRDELEFLPNIKEAIDIAKTMFDYVFVISNQPDLETGDMKYSFLYYVDSVLKTTYGIDEINNAHIRGQWDYKPNPGAVLNLQIRYDLDLSQSCLIGDTWKDCVAATLAKVKYIHVGDKDPIGPFNYRSKSLLDAVKYMEYKKRFKEN